MKKVLSENELKQIPLTALLCAAGIVLPQFFHLVGLGSAFLPMFIPVVLGSLLLYWHFALALAIICPIFSWLLTGMPPLVPPVLPILIFELVSISLVIPYLKKKFKLSNIVLLLIGILVDRFVLFLIISLIAPVFGFNHSIFSLALVISGFPGIVLQIIVIPPLIKMIHKNFHNILPN